MSPIKIVKHTTKKETGSLMVREEDLEEEPRRDVDWEGGGGGGGGVV